MVNLFDRIKKLDLAEVCYKSGEYKKALKICRNLLFILDERSEIYADVKLLMAQVYFSISFFDKSLKKIISARKIYFEYEDFDKIALCNKIIGNNYAKIGKYDTALEFFNKVRSYYFSGHKKREHALILNNIGVLYTFMKRFDKAESIYKMAIKIIKSDLDEEVLANLNLNIAELFLKKNQLSKAHDYILKSMTFFSSFSNKIRIIEIKMLLGKFHIKKKEYVKAKEIFLELKDLTEKYNLKQDNKKVRKKLGMIYEFLGDYENAYKCFKKISKIQNEEIKNNYSNKLAILTADFELDLSIKKNDIQTMENIKLEKTLDNLELASENLIEKDKENTILTMAVTANHEINQPLLIISGNLELLEMINKKKEAEDIFKKISVNMESIKKFVNNINKVDIHD